MTPARETPRDAADPADAIRVARVDARPAVETGPPAAGARRGFKLVLALKEEEEEEEEVEE